MSSSVKNFETTQTGEVTAIFDKIAVENRGQAIVAARVAGLGAS